MLKHFLRQNSCDASHGPGRQDKERQTYWRILERYSRPTEFMKRRFDPSIRVGLYLTLGILVTVATASVFGLLLGEVIEGETQAAVDGPLARFIVEHRTSKITGIMQVATQMGSLLLVTCVMGAIAGFAWLRTRDGNLAAFFLAILIGALALDDAIKFFVGRPRPSLGPLVHATGSSFPSGHALSATAMCAAIAYVLSHRSGWRSGLWIWAIALFLSSLVAASRVYLGCTGRPMSSAE